MSNKNIYILSGPIQSGKTTRLLNWSSERNDIYGILTPDVGGIRVFMDVNSKSQFAMEAAIDDLNVMAVGRFVFSRSAFQKAGNIIRDSLNHRQGWVVIDEIGPLELNDDGFAGVLNDVIHSINTTLNILLVVREGLCEQVRIKFGVSDAVVISSIDNLI